MWRRSPPGQLWALNLRLDGQVEAQLPGAAALHLEPSPPDSTWPDYQELQDLIINGVFSKDKPQHTIT